MPVRAEVWAEKYRPKRVSDLIYYRKKNQEALQKFVSWMKQWLAGTPPTKRAALLYGPPGTGKTSLVHAFAREHGLVIFEVNASDQRSGERIMRVVEESSASRTLTGAGRVLLIDEVDGISPREDRGLYGALVKAIPKSRVPIVMTANDPWSRSGMRPLLQLCELIKFERRSERALIRILEEIARKEKVSIDKNALKALIKKEEGDLRSAINDLQALAALGRHITAEDIERMGQRVREYEIFEYLRRIFYAKSIKKARALISSSPVDPDMLFEWIYENIPQVLTDPRDLVRAMWALSEADILRAEMKQRQYWTLLKYVIDLMMGGVAAAFRYSKPPGFVPMHFPERIRILAKTKREREKLREIALRAKPVFHVSTRRFLTRYLPYLRVICSNDPKARNSLAQALQLTDKEMDFLIGKTREVEEKRPAKRVRRRARRRGSRA